MLGESHRPGIEPTTCKSQVQHPTAKPPRNTGGEGKYAGTNGP